MAGLMPAHRRLVPAQIEDLAAIDALGNRLDAYRAITTPVTLLSGDRSPAHLIERVAALAGILPTATWVRLPGRDHGAGLKAPPRWRRSSPTPPPGTSGNYPVADLRCASVMRTCTNEPVNA